MMCILNNTECPTACPKGENQCIDGTCSKEPCNEDLESPCWCEPLVIACPRPIDYFENCQNDYGALYENYTLCVEDYEESIEKVSYSNPIFMFCYFWIVLMTIFVFAWCLYNQRLFPVNGSVKTLIPVTAKNVDEEAKWVQIGYKNNFIGSMLNLLVWITLFGIHGLLLVLTLFYYTQQLEITAWRPVFLDEVQVLFVFQ
jgi:hypothetical protein